MSANTFQQKKLQERKSQLRRVIKKIYNIGLTLQESVYDPGIAYWIIPFFLINLLQDLFTEIISHSTKTVTSINFHCVVISTENVLKLCNNYVKSGVTLLRKQKLRKWNVKWESSTHSIYTIY